MPLGINGIKLGWQQYPRAQRWWMIWFFYQQQAKILGKYFEWQTLSQIICFINSLIHLPKIPVRRFFKQTWADLDKLKQKIQNRAAKIRGYIISNDTNQERGEGREFHANNLDRAIRQHSSANQSLKLLQPQLALHNPSVPESTFHSLLCCFLIPEKQRCTIIYPILMHPYFMVVEMLIDHCVLES